MNNFLASEEYEQALAIIGISGRFPGAQNLNEFWENLSQGKESISFFEAQQNQAENEYYGHYVGAFGALRDIENFDADFFNFTPREAELTDPQRRLLFECAHEALEDAGYNPETYKGRIGVYVGEGFSDYFMSNLKQFHSDKSNSNLFHLMISNINSFASTQLSYKFNLKGPSINISTTCSTSLVSVHEACKSLLVGESDMVLAGGVRVAIPQNRGYFYEEGGINSPDGHCRAFDANAKGTVGGNGGGIVILKRLKDVINDGDSIHAIIRGSAVNNDGSSKVGYTAPSIEGQAHVITESLLFSGVSPASISYIETHGTGTQLGDPIEIKALADAFRLYNLNRNTCAIGSTKPNIGHLDVGAGIASLIKTILALKNKKIPPLINFEILNPQINFESTPFYINTILKDWDSSKHPRRAGVSSFGVGGTNAHLILEEAPDLPSDLSPQSYYLINLSAKTQSALEKLADNFTNHIANSKASLSDVAYTLQVGRRNHPVRTSIVCKDKNEININELKNNISRSYQQNLPRSIIFMFPGQGSQHVHMASILFKENFLFRNNLEECARILKSLLNIDIIELIYPPSSRVERCKELIKETYIAQPVIFSIEYSLAQFWISLGVKPDFMIGHSIGEYAAATLSGVFTLEEALFIISERGALMQSVSKGAMLSVSMNEKKVLSIIPNDLEIAAVNGITSCVVSGPTKSVDVFAKKLSKEAISSTPINTSHAFHSSSMDSILDVYEEKFRKIPLKQVTIPFISNLTGKLISNVQAQDPRYWVNHLRKPVRFYEGLDNISLKNNPIFLEVGPNQTLTYLANLSFPERASSILSSLPHVKESLSDKSTFLTVLGKLWGEGISIKWENLYEGEHRKRVSLPTYPFEKKRYWISNKKDNNDENISTDYPNEKVNYFYVPSWKRSFLQKNTIHIGSNLKGLSLVFCDKNHFSHGATVNVNNDENTVILVYSGVQYKKISENEYLINPLHRGDYVKLFEELRSIKLNIANIIHMWSLVPNASTFTFEEKQLRGYYSLVYISQLLKNNLSIKIVIVSNELQSINGNDRLDAEKSTILSLCKTIPQEYSNISCSNIDFVWEDIGIDFNFLMEKIKIEIDSKCSDNIVCYRGNHRWIQDFLPFQIEREKSPFKLVHKGVYIITGGLGRIGLLISEYLIQKCEATTILISRGPLQNRTELNNLEADNSSKSDIEDKDNFVKNLKNKGGIIEICQGDVSDFNEMQSLFDYVEEKYGRINGVIHAAGNMDKNAFKLLEDITDHQFEDLHFKPKISGLKVLDKVLQNRSYDFLINMSSLSSVLGGVGYSAYAAANIYLDTFTKQHNQTHDVTWGCVNWEGWNFKVSLSDNAKNKYDLTPSEGIGLVDLILSTPLQDQIVISKGSLKKRLKTWVNSSDNESKEFSSNCSETWHLQTKYSLSERIKYADLIKEIWEDLLGIKNIKETDNFFSLGGDSLLAIRVTSALRKIIQADISIKNIFEYPTIFEFSSYLNKLQKSERTQSEKDDILFQKIQRIFPLSFSQQRLWYVEQFNSENKGLYNMAVAFKIKGNLNLNSLESAVHLVIERHNILKASIVSNQGIPEQHIQEDVSFKIQFEDVSFLQDVLRKEKMDLLIQKVAWDPFDLERPPLLRVLVIQEHDSNYTLLIAMPHLVADDWSFEIFYKEVGEFYNNLIKGKKPAFKRPDFQYTDYVKWERDNIQGERLNKQLTYWKYKLMGAPEVLNLSITKKRKNKSTSHGKHYNLNISKDLCDTLHKTSEEKGVTRFVLLLAAYKLLLHNYSLEDKIVVGTPIANRSLEDTENLIGFFSNTLALCTDCSENPSCTEFINRTKQTVLESYDYQDTPIDKVVEFLAKKRDLSHHPIFQMWFAFHQEQNIKLELEGIEVERVLLGNDVAKFDILLSIVEKEKNLSLYFQYSDELFDEESIVEFARNYIIILKSICEEPQRKINELSLFNSFTSLNKNIQVELINEADGEFENILDLLDKTSKEISNKISLIYNNISISYEELISKSNQIANYLIEKEIGSKATIALCHDRSIDLVIYILAILKTGNAFLILDLSIPQSRLDTILADVRPVTIICSPSLSEKFIDCEYNVLNTNEFKNNFSFLSSSCPFVKIEPDDTAYIIYTSGSSGNPKGVSIKHSNLAYYIPTMIDEIGLNKDDVYAHTASFSFSSSIRQLFVPLINGNTLSIANDEERKQPEKFIKYLYGQKINVIDIVPTFLCSCITFFNKNPNDNIKDLLSGLKLRLILSASEIMFRNMPSLWHEFFGKNVIILNMYGQTETSGIVALGNVDHMMESDCNSIPIGKPITKTSLYIVNENNEFLPKGALGEIVISGNGISGGYINQPKLTKELFIKKNSNGVEITYYKTGDIGRYLPGGNIEYIGRKDTQIKVKGYRIELGEIESAISRHSDVLQVATALKNDINDNKYIIAFVVGGVFRPTPTELKQFLSHSLPEYMIPRRFFFLDELPLNPNGKVDRNSLLLFDNEESCYDENKIVFPQTEVEKKLMDIWCNVLDRQQLSINDNFFENGGDSILSIQVVSRACQQGLMMTTTDLFHNPTIEDLSKIIENKQSKASLRIDSLSSDEISRTHFKDHLDLKGNLKTTILPFRKGGKYPPLFFIHPLGGGVSWYSHLAQEMDNELSLYGVNSVYSINKKREFLLIEEMAQFYIKEIQRIQSAGPYYIGGWSFGALVAYEISRQLEFMNEELSGLFLIDFPSRISRSNINDNLNIYINTYGNLQKSTHFNTEDKSYELDNPFLEKIDNGITFLNLLALREYNLSSKVKKIIFFESEENLNGQKKKNSNDNQGWSAYSVNRCHSYIIQGNHYSMMKKPSINIIARIISDYMKGKIIS